MWVENDYEITNCNISGDCINVWSPHSYTFTNFTRGKVTYDGNATSGFLNIYLQGYQRDLYETRNDQISVVVTDPNSIKKYGERDGGSIEYPLLETEAQCKALGSKIIRDSHRLGQQIDFLIPFNTLIQTGQTIAIIDKKIGLTERYYIEAVNHNIDIAEGKIKARTQIGGVYYT